MRTERLPSREREIMETLRQRPRLEGQHVTDVIYCNRKAWLFARLQASAVIPPTPYEDATLLRMLIGSGMGQVLEAGRVSQIQTISPDTEDVGTVDVWLRDHPAEIKVTYLSTSRNIMDQAHWLEQVGEYTCRSTKRERSPWAELWVVHLLGDHGKKLCPEHGVPEEAVKAKHPETGRPRLVCPECGEFLADGNRDTTLRCYRIEWTWDELEALHDTHAWRQGQLQRDIMDPQYGLGNLPPVRWGYQAAFECKGCPFMGRECPGVESSLEQQLEASLRARGVSIEEIFNQIEEEKTHV
jgi:hypothetical protein